MLEASLGSHSSALSPIERRLAEEDAQRIREGMERKAIRAILVTTEMQPDIRIRKRITIVTAEVAYGMNVFKDIFASVRNIVGGRSEAVQKTMRDARETVLHELKREAHAVGANAVVAVDLDYTQIGDSGWNMVLVIASGTAVVADIEEPPQ
jgi:uncharacterized protein YbjQ (UPF0145 family)